jgi:hypothetical protein
MKTVQTTLLSVLLLAFSSARLVAVGGPEIVILTPPLSLAANVGGDVILTVLATGPGVLSYQWWHGDKLIQGATNFTLTIPNAQIADAGEYVARIMRGGQGIETSPAVLTVGGVSVQDVSGPELNVTSPPGSFARVYGDQFTFTGTANDDTGVIGIYYQQNGNPWVTLPLAVDWTCGVTLQPGTNVFLFRAADVVGNYSAAQKVVLFYSVPQPLSLTIVGNGHVTGAVNDQGLESLDLEIGRNYTLRAIPTAGNYFSYWDANGVVSTDPALNLFMGSNSTLTAHFVANPFLSLQGNYTALFYDNSNPVHETSGLLTFKLTDQGKFSGKLVLGGTSYTCSGQFGMDLRVQSTIVRNPPGTGVVVVALQLAPISDRVTGSISDGVQTSTVEGYRATFHSTLNPAASFAGKYTLAISGNVDSSAGPQGKGYGTVTVTTAGAVTFKGGLGEGTPATQKVPLASNGQWAFYVPLHKGRGSILGWMTLADTDSSDVSGLLLWTKPAGVPGMLYPTGFVNEVTTIGSRYLAPASGTRALNFSNSAIRLEGGNLTAPLTQDVFLNEFNKVILLSAGTNKLAITLSTSSGLISGSFVNPQTLKKSVIKGALLQKQNFGSGYFLGTNQSGSVFFGLP